jgi:hypothetical protein
VLILEALRSQLVQAGFTPLLTHAIELSLKALALHSVPPQISRPPNHDLRGWYQLALQYGLSNEPRVAENINRLHELHFTHYTRYPPKQELAIPVPDLSVIVDETVDHLIDKFTPIINPRYEDAPTRPA